jgi:hypothetical protein
VLPGLRLGRPLSFSRVTWYRALYLNARSQRWTERVGSQYVGSAKQQRETAAHQARGGVPSPEAWCPVPTSKPAGYDDMGGSAHRRAPASCCADLCTRPAQRPAQVPCDASAEHLRSRRRVRLARSSSLGAPGRLAAVDPYRSAVMKEQGSGRPPGAPQTEAHMQ